MRLYPSRCFCCSQKVKFSTRLLKTVIYHLLTIIFCFVVWNVAFLPVTYAQNKSHVVASVSGEVTQQDAQQILSILNDPKKREEFSKTLALMVKVLPSTQTIPQEQPVTIDSDIYFEWRGLLRVAHVIHGYVHDFVSFFYKIRVIGVWFHKLVHSPALYKIGVNVFSSALLVLSIALVIEYLTSVALQKPLRKVTYWAKAHQQTLKTFPIEKETNQLRWADFVRSKEALHYLLRVPYALIHFLLKLVPVGMCLFSGYIGAEFLTETDKTRLAIVAIVNAYVGARVVYLVGETLLVQHSPAIRLIPVSDSIACSLTRWWNVLVAVPSVMVCLPTLGGVFDLPYEGENIMLRIVSLVQHLIIAVFLWRIRDIVSQMLQPAPDRMKNIMWACVGFLIRLWWVIAIIFDMVLWFVWAMNFQKDYQWLSHGLVFSFVCLLFSWILTLLIYGVQDRLFLVSAPLREHYPDLQKKMDFYYPFVHYTTMFVILLGTLIALAQCWRLPLLTFLLTSKLGDRFTSAFLCLLTGVIVAVLTWECVNALLNKQIMRYISSDQKARVSRLRTVLPIIRTTMLLIIIVLVLVTTLAQMGINVAPLLTGAGILGVGLSFGSQSLVKDVITGFFMLAEDAIQVGDWVTTGGIKGKVEHLSIRALRVRSFDGDLHIIPFSSVTSIANTAREFNRVIVRITLDVGEDSERVAKIFKDAVCAMRQDEEYKSMIYSDYVDFGVEKADENGAVLVGMVKTAPMMKWRVQSELYRRACPIMTQMGVQFYVNTNYTPDIPLHVVVDAEKKPAPSQAQQSHERDGVDPKFV